MPKNFTSAMPKLPTPGQQYREGAANKDDGVKMFFRPGVGGSLQLRRPCMSPKLWRRGGFDCKIFRNLSTYSTYWNSLALKKSINRI